MRAARLLTVFAGALMGCSALIGVKDLYLDADGGPGGSDGSVDGSSSGSSGTSSGSSGTSSGSSGTSGSSGDAQPDTGNCGDTTKSAQNCGRCGHDCQGGTCTNSKCDPVPLASGLENPSGLALDTTNVYYTTFGGTGSVALVPKAGGAPHGLATGQTKARGVQLDGTTLYWSNEDYLYDGTNNYRGGVWKCTLPACATPSLVAPGDWALNVQLANGNVYFNADNDGTVRVALPDGGSATVATTNHAFGLGVDSNYAYYTSSQPNLYRSALDGGVGKEEAVGPLNANYVGFVALDTTKFYWVYTDISDAGHVFGAAKADPTNRTEYAGAESAGPVGVAVDAANIYWTTSGTYTNTTPNGDGKLYTCPLAGCPAGGPTVLADKLYDAGPIVLDATTVYWAEFGDYPGATGKIRKVAKP